MNYQSLKIDELKELLKEKGLSVVGRKQQLIQALIIHDSQNNVNNSSFTDDSSLCSANKEGSSVNNKDADKIEENSGNKVEQEMKTNKSELNTELSNKIKPTICINDVNQLTEQERIELRRQKFGICESLTEDQKRLARMKRFGFRSESDKLRLRRERFGMISESDKIRQRKERFGTISKAVDSEHEKKIQARKLRFGLKP
ncbi:hypothetical protein FG379_000948 [Cryptosporidium bovis]|uniref:uncharacterized protein n=1 Tax=Cryptosporidium bovis TaxID=310047 RepID=UPI003519ECCC|nr:hypothetical protein FG379_000948 [Cryptosporidium bovis]